VKVGEWVALRDEGGFPIYGKLINIEHKDHGNIEEHIYTLQRWPDEPTVLDVLKNLLP
jgi:hypothetical protein